MIKKLKNKLRASQKTRRKNAARLAMLEDKSTIPLNHHSEQIIKRLLKDGTPDYSKKTRVLEAELTESIIIGENGLRGGTGLEFCQDFGPSGATTYISVRGSGKRQPFFVMVRELGWFSVKKGVLVTLPNKEEQYPSGINS